MASGGQSTQKNPGSVAFAASALVGYAVDKGLIDQLDATWAYNAILATIGATGPGPTKDAYDPATFDLQATLSQLTRIAIANGVSIDSCDDNLGIPTQIMGQLMPRPSQMTAKFYELLNLDPNNVDHTVATRRATDWFYQLCCDADYVRRSAIARDIKWITTTRWGDLEITINRSKPEKDPRAIAAAGKTQATTSTNDANPASQPYPPCALCMANEGYAGRSANRDSVDAKGHPARQNLRIVPLDLGGHVYGLQYSPYAYYQEHCIVMNAQHVPMHVDRSCLERLLDFVDLFPHYFIGSNAGLPIVGGSILAHDHFQGGAHVFPMEKAPDVAGLDNLAFTGASGVWASVIAWPLTVIRLRATDRQKLANVAAHIMNIWQSWDDPAVGIISHGDHAGDMAGTPHNAVTPIVRHVQPGQDQFLPDGGYIMHLALRCNITTPDRPLGLFHPRPELHHIKKENIGLIEVMGLAVLPARLERELTAVADALLNGGDLNASELTAKHAVWARDVAARHPELTAANAREILQAEVGQVFAQVLEDAGVFKWDATGRAALVRFLAAL